MASGEDDKNRGSGVDPDWYRGHARHDGTLHLDRQLSQLWLGQRMSPTNGELRRMTRPQGPDLEVRTGPGRRWER